MFLPITGLSVITHLIIIVSAAVVNMLRKQGDASAYQTFNKQGGFLSSRRANTILSIGILVFVTLYMLILGGVALYSAYIIGMDEPQRLLFARFSDVLSASMRAHPFIYMNSFFLTLIILSIFFHEKIARFMPVRGVHYVIDVVYGAILKISLKTGALFTRMFHRITTAFGVLHGSTIGRPFAISFHSIAARVTVGIILSALFFGLSFMIASAQIVEPGFESEEVASGFTLATAVDFTPDGRIFIAEKSGVIRVVKNGTLLPTPLITLTDINTFGDRGLLGIAVDPAFETNGYVYLSYTYENTPGLNVAGPKTGRIVRITVVGDTADEASKLALVGTVGGGVGTPSCEDFLVTIDCIPSDSNSHSVGGLRFGPDGKLYATLGDGADFTDVDPRALRSQNIDALAGKLLRINTDGTAPSDNPFYNGDPNANRSKVYAFGLRNAFRFNFNETTGQLYLGDVGWSSWEEVNRVTPGANFGWPCREGNGATSYGCTPSSTTTDPLYTYPHNGSGAGSITAGAFATNNAYPDAYDTSLFIGDYAQMWMKRLVLNASGTAVVSVENFIPNLVWPVEILTGPDGNVYYIDIVTGSLNRFTHTSGNRRPVVTISGNPTSGLAPLSVTFSSVGTNDPDGNPISYVWNFGDGATSSAPNPAHTYTANGSYTASLSVTDSNGAETTKSLSILVGNQRPTGAITSPSSGSLYHEGDTLVVTGAGTDPETGTLSPSAFSWEVILHHNTHIHVIQTVSGTTSISFPADPHNATDVYMEVRLTVTDPAGLTDTKTINLYLNNGAGSGNLVSNSSLEIEGALPSAPLDWYQGWFGVMNPIFTYPAPGLVGDRAARVEVTSYTSGSARWYFTPVSVTPGKTYNFSDMYTSTVPTDVLAQFGMPNGTYEYAYIAGAPSAATGTRFTGSFTVPANAVTATVFHELVSVGTLTVDDYSLTLAGDVTPPTGTITSPANGATVSDALTVTVDAVDDTGLTTAELLVNGTPVGVPDSEAPFSLVWDTNSVADGAYTLAVRILDTSANEGVTPNISVTVANSVVNLYDNGDFEIASGTNPRSWQPGGWGTLEATYSYPIPGHTGNGIGITVTKADIGDTGDARWVHAPIPVQSGIEYTYEAWYMAPTITDVLGSYKFADGSRHYFGLIKEIPGTSTWTKISNTFVPPVGAIEVTLDHAISAGGATLVTDDVKLYVSGTGTPSEINTPTVDFISPTQGAVLSGQVTLTATSSDDTAVVGVFFAVNGSPIGVEDLTAPYQAVLDTTTYPNGTYILKATTRDPYGNNDNKTITVTFNNTPTTSTNLITNGTLETPGTGGNPANWNRGGWGTNTRTFTYPGAGFSGNGAQVTISGYTNGDAKWFFDPIAVTPGTTYTIGEQYNSSIASQMLVRYTQTGGAFTYTTLDNLASTGGTWQTYAKTVTPPAGVTHLTLFHVIAGNGSLTIDDVSVTGPGSTSTPDTVAPTVSVTSPTASTTLSGTTTITVSATDNIAVSGVTLLVDGSTVGSPDTTAPYNFTLNTGTLSNGVHTIGARATDAAGNIGTATGVNVTINNASGTPAYGNNLVRNPSLETEWSATQPEYWLQGGWGTNARTFTYPVAGQVGRGAEVQITSYTSGDAKWYFVPVSDVAPGKTYTFSNSYKSTTGSDVVVQYMLPSGQYQYEYLAGLPSTGGVWATFLDTFTTPANTIGVTVFHTISSVGTLTVDDYSLRENSPTGADIFPPSVTIITPQSSSVVSGTISVEVETSDDSGINRVEMSIDTILVATDTSFPYSFVLDTTSYTNATHTILVRSWDNAGNSSWYPADVLIDNSSSSPADIIAPVVDIVSPISGTSVSGNTSVSVSAVDNVTVMSVTLLVDGSTVGSPDTTAPYNFTLNTGTLSNGVHTIGARATDAAGNVGTATGVTVTIANGTSTGGGINLINNADFEIAGPAGWTQDEWGTNAATFTYPVAGVSGSAAQVSLSSHSSGDAKWFFDDVTVEPGSSYTFTYAYKADVSTSIVVRYTEGDGTVNYETIDVAPVSTTWNTRTTTLIPPQDTVSVTVMHILAHVGTLTIDDQYLGLSSGNLGTFNRGKVSFSFDDGWLEHYEVARPILDAAGIDGTFYIVTNEMENASQLERVSNSGLETVGVNGDPEGWGRGNWGANTATFTYPVPGATGNGAEISVTDYVDGDAKWYFTPVTVMPNIPYTVGDSYKSTVSTRILARYTMIDGSFTYLNVVTLPSTGGVWQTVSEVVIPPAEASELTLFHLIEDNGSLTIDKVSVRPEQEYVDENQVGIMHASGHEIGVHTRSHAALSTLSLSEKQDEIAGARQVLMNAGFGPVTTIAYPYGDFDTEVQQVAEDSGLILGRSVLGGYNDATTDPYALRVQAVNRSVTLAEMQGWVAKAAEDNTWLILMFHQIDSNPDAVLGITENDFSALVDYTVGADVDVITVAEGASLLGL